MPQRRCRVRYFADRVGRQRVAVLEGVDAHVLGAVVLEHAAQVRELGDDDDVGDEDRDPDDALDEPEEEALAEPVVEQAGEEQRREEEEGDGEPEGDDERDADLLLAELLLLLAERLVGRHRQGAHADDERLDERHDAADDGQLEDGVADHPGDEREVVQADGLVGAAYGERPVVHAAHHDALDHGLAADLGLARGERRQSRDAQRPRGHTGAPARRSAERAAHVTEGIGRAAPAP